ncbi:hypothetical protein SH661x_002911 [Planctomicrobium sp. SH661]|uniref:hypothetical protein n=1 Tax=Planctomicrobium sp. SH661 TaxID=3448124 RepID=UPI003F5B9363
MTRSQLLKTCFLTAMFVQVASIATAIELPLTGNSNQWNSSSGGKTTVQILSQNPLQAEVNVGGGAEGFPSLNWGSPEPQDWRLYNRISCDVLLESTAPGIREGGKYIAFCLYDRKCRHESIEGKPAKQQCINVDLSEGKWQKVTIDMTGWMRSEVSSIDIYLYDMPHNYPHTYKMTFKNLRLEGEDPNKTLFDGAVFEPRALTGGAKDAAYSLETEDGLKLTLSSNGGIQKITTFGQSVGDGRTQISGILLRDAKTTQPPVMVGGVLEKTVNGIQQIGEVPSLDIKFNATYRAEKNRILVDGIVESTQASDRAITVYVALPISPSSTWNWFLDLNNSVQPFEEMKKVPTYEVQNATFPLAVLSDAQRKKGIGLLIDQQRPVQFRLAVNPRERLMYAAFDFGLIPEKGFDGRNLAAGEFHLEIIAVEPAWGIRSGVASLYELHPENFLDRVGHGGGWEVDGARRKAQNSPEDLIASGLRFEWTAAENDQETWEWNARNGVKNLIYIEPDFLQFSMGDLPAPATPDAQKRLEKLSSGDQQEWAAFLPLHYSKAATSNRHLQLRDSKEYLSKLLSSQNASVMYDRNGEPVLGLGYRPGWIGDSGFGVMSPANLAPAIPDGRGSMIIHDYFQYFDDAISKLGWSPIDGFCLDSFLEVPNDFRRENFAYMQSPVAFDPVTKLPMAPKGFGAVEWLKEVRRHFAPRNMIIMANCFGPMTFTAPELDVFGLENTQVIEPQYFRVIAGPRRPITFLPYDPPSQAILDYHLFWGIYPGRDVPVDVLKPMIPVLDKLYQATWQPVTGIRSEFQEIQIERYGQKTDEEIYIAVHNPTLNEGTVELKLENPRIGVRTRAEGLYNETAPLTIQGNRLRLHLGKMQTKVLRLSR